MLSQTILGFALSVGVAVSSPAARAPDPCQQATRDAEDAEDAYWRWCANHDKRYGACVAGSSPRGAQLYAEMERTAARRSEACS